MDSERKTIMDIAKLAGVSKSTASRALRKSPLCSKKTVEKVCKIAEECGYKPNMMFSIMASMQKKKQHHSEQIGIAILYDPPTETQARNTIKGDKLLYEKIADEYNFYVDAFNVREVRPPNEFTHMLYNRGYSGIILSEIYGPSSIVYRLNLDNFSVICHGGYFHGTKYNRVIGDIFQGIQLCWGKMVEAGRKRIGVATCRYSNPPILDDIIRHSAVLVHQNDIPVKDRVPPYLGFVPNIDAFVEWFKKYRPDGVIGFSVGQYYAIKDLGVRIPEEVSFATLNHPDIYFSKHDFISGIMPIKTNTWFHVMSLMDQLIRNRILGMPEHSITVNIEPSWNEGKTMR